MVETFAVAAIVVVAGLWTAATLLKKLGSRSAGGGACASGCGGCASARAATGNGKGPCAGLDASARPTEQLGTGTGER